MKNHGDPIVLLEGKLWENGSKDFVNKGINQRWKGELSHELSERYERIAKMKLGRDCYWWYSQT